ncbi:hypothetical protein Bcp1_075 [Bacillus phage Bcp1]|uniref:DUF7349 domain-containing protein n=1 Tax=Bacillus phage Bcp1 TaxID=584892 RepID=X2JMR5_9CAUD|nr:hypothetical protein Bcp1_075 [Bacillus phage Bcp1]AHN66552.1 hypothetical protein Bcp1_075 [Bacillus phage Bcp1]
MLVHDYFKNHKVATVYGDINFDEKGESEDLTLEQQKEFKGHPGFNFVEPKKEVKKAPAKAKVNTKKEE